MKTTTCNLLNFDSQNHTKFLTGQTFDLRRRIGQKVFLTKINSAVTKTIG